MADGTHAGDAIVELEVAEIVPGERRYAIAEADPKFAERTRKSTAAPLDIRICGSMERRASEVRNHFRCAAMTRGVNNKRGDQQRVALHQSNHWCSPCGARQIETVQSVFARTLHDFDVLNNPRPRLWVGLDAFRRSRLDRVAGFALASDKCSTLPRGWRLFGSRDPAF
jgi:hypothetical protein